MAVNPLKTIHSSRRVTDPQLGRTLSACKRRARIKKKLTPDAPPLEPNLWLTMTPRNFPIYYRGYHAQFGHYMYEYRVLPSEF